MPQNADAREAVPGATVICDADEIAVEATTTAVNGQAGALRLILEQACAEAKCSAKALTVLAPANDPFRVDTPFRRRDGEWLAMHAARLGLGNRKIHLRGLHYMLVSAGDVVKPDGQPYTNIDPNWEWLVDDAAKAARWLCHIPFDQIVDARNAEPVIRPAASRSLLPPRAHISVGLDVTVPDAVDLEPWVYVDPFEVPQPYRIVFYGEKTSLEEILDPIAARVGADLYLPAGELTDTQLHTMAKTGAVDGRPMVVLAFADCDPSGWQMAISIGRKLQAFKALLYPDLEFQVRRVALTPEQVRLHGLPSTPLKDTEKRADKWREATGIEQTEIDALAALRPDLLRQIVEQAVAPFFDSTLSRRCSRAANEWRQVCQEAIDAQTDQDHLDALAAEANEALDAVRQEIERLSEQIRIDPSGYSLPPRPVLPEPEITAEPDGLPLIDSDWSWADQSRRLIASKAYDGAGGGA
jgi:hypothetical protein